MVAWSGVAAVGCTTVTPAVLGGCGCWHVLVGVAEVPWLLRPNQRRRGDAAAIGSATALHIARGDSVGPARAGLLVVPAVGPLGLVG